VVDVGCDVHPLVGSHKLFCELEPTHSAPPPAGKGVEHVRVRCVRCMAPNSVHVDHADHWLHPPSTIATVGTPPGAAVGGSDSGPVVPLIGEVVTVVCPVGDGVLGAGASLGAGDGAVVGDSVGPAA
jgi:hypothetical protein